MGENRNSVCNGKINIFKRNQPSGVEPHTHIYLELVYVYEGEGIQTVNSKSRQVTRGDLLFYNIGDIHCLNSSTNISAINIQIFPGMLNDSLSVSENAMDILSLGLFNEFSYVIDGFPPKVTFMGKELIEVDHIIMQMHTEFETKRKGYFSILFGYMNVLLGKLFRKIYEDTRLDLRENTVSLAPDVLSYIEKNYNKKITVQELARKSFYNPSYYVQLFRECFGMTPVQYVNQKRMEKAIEFLVTTNLSVEDIMKAVGYSDKKHFYSLFKHYTGLTPALYRKNK